MITQLEPQLAALAGRQGSVVLRRQALDCGYSDQEIEQLLRDGLWVRIRRGAYIERVVWAAMDREARHRVTVNAVTLVLEKPAVVSHISACVMLNLPTWGFDLSQVHVTRGDLHSPRRRCPPPRRRNRRRRHHDRGRHHRHTTGPNRC